MKVEDLRNRNEGTKENPFQSNPANLYSYVILGLIGSNFQQKAIDICSEEQFSKCVIQKHTAEDFAAWEKLENFILAVADEDVEFKSLSDALTEFGRICNEDEGIFFDEDITDEANDAMSAPNGGMTAPGNGESNPPKEDKSDSTKKEPVLATLPPPGDKTDPVLLQGPVSKSDYDAMARGLSDESKELGNRFRNTVSKTVWGKNYRAMNHFLKNPNFDESYQPVANKAVKDMYKALRIYHSATEAVAANNLGKKDSPVPAKEQPAPKNSNPTPKTEVEKKLEEKARIVDMFDYCSNHPGEDADIILAAIDRHVIDFGGFDKLTKAAFRLMKMTLEAEAKV